MSEQQRFFVQTTGPTTFPRYRILDCGKGFWTGDNWDMDESRACLYHQFEDAAADLRAIKIHENADKARRRLKATVMVDLIGDGEVNIEQLADHLADVARLTTTDNPPGMLLFLRIDWGTLEEADTNPLGGSPADDHSA